MFTALPWFIVAVALSMGKTIATGLLFAPLIFGALISAGIAWAGTAGWVQILVFAIVSTAFAVGGVAFIP